MKIGIVGAGVSGIVSLKYATDTSHECDCYEETDSYGGTWVYTNKTGIDDNGLQVYRNMYKNLVTNLPIQTMEFSGFPYKTTEKNVFIKQPEVLQYITDYVNTYNLGKHIKYNHQVIRIEPLPSGKWLVFSKNAKTKVVTFKLYDFVIICNGRSRYPKIPQIPGQDVFKGLQMHSNNYRTPEMFENKRLLIIGGSSSGIDICRHLIGVTKTVYLSHWKPLPTKIQNLVCCKPAVSRLKENTVVFADNTSEDIDFILYCTGYEYKFPFLPKSCGITIHDNWITPLYKDIVNIKHPTMFFIGIPFFSAAFLLGDIQARFVMTIINKKITLPTESAMLDELNSHIENLKKVKVPQRHYHKLGLKQRHYFADLDRTGLLKPFPPICNDMYDYTVYNATTLLTTERRICGTVVKENSN